MKISTRGRYGLRLMMELANQYSAMPVQIRLLAKAQEIPEKYVHSILARLRIAKFIRAIRGKKGGYVLTLPPEQIRVNEVFRILEGDIFPTDCVLNPALCGRSKLCVTRDVWTEMGNAVEATLAKYSLADLITCQKLKENTPLDYSI